MDTEKAADLSLCLAVFRIRHTISKSSCNRMWCTSGDWLLVVTDTADPGHLVIILGSNNFVKEGLNIEPWQPQANS
jgi:hypothetical protein